MLKCSICGEEKDKSEFSRKNDSNRGFSYRCKECHNKYGKEHYRKNYKKYVKATSEYKKKKKEYVAKYKIDKGCEICGFNKTSSALDLHHVNREDKDGHPSFITLNNGFDRINDELEKCIVVCANCHRMVHSGEIVIDNAERK